jgi:hypothetical protein
VGVGGVEITKLSKLAVIAAVGVSGDLGVALAVAVNVGVIVTACVDVGVDIKVDVGGGVATPGKYTPMGCTPGKMPKGLLPGVLCSAATTAGSRGPNGVITTTGVAVPATDVPRTLAVTTPGASVFSIAT